MAERKGGKQPWKRKPESGENRPERKKFDGDQDRRTGRSEDFDNKRRSGRFEERPEGKRSGRFEDKGASGKPGKYDDRPGRNKSWKSDDRSETGRQRRFEDKPERNSSWKNDNRSEMDRQRKSDDRPGRYRPRKFEDRNEMGNQRKFGDASGKNKPWKSEDRPERKKQGNFNDRPERKRQGNFDDRQDWNRTSNNRSRPERKDNRNFEERPDRKGYGFKERPERKKFDNSGERPERKRFGSSSERPERKRYNSTDERPEKKRFDSPGERPARKRFNSTDERPERKKFDNSGERPERKRFDNSGERSEGRRYDKPGKKEGRNRYSRMEERPDKNRHGKYDSHRTEADTEEKPFVHFAQLLLDNDPEKRSRRFNADIDIEPFTDLSYEDELKKKNEAIRKFWKEHGLPLKPESVVPSPKPRNYRTTSKRRVIRVKSRFHLAFSTDLRNVSENVFIPSPLETEEHAGIYSYIAGRINEPVYNLIGSILNFIIIRGSYSEFAVIFNVRNLTGPAVRKLKALAEEVKEQEPRVISSFIYLDPSESDYYLESFRPLDQISFKKLFGPDKLFVRFDERTYSFHPTGFSQVNQSMIPVMLKKAKDMLLPTESSSFIDLYCGYGLFALYFADHFEETLGIEAEGNSIRSAIENKSHFKTEGKVRFTAKRITAESLEDALPENYTSEVYLLDPPRQGTEKGVIKEIAKRMPEKALHIFCNVDRIPLELKEWKKNDYIMHKVVPLDMFPGTPNLEVLILFKRR